MKSSGGPVLSSKMALPSLLILASVWALVLGWWQSNDFSPTTRDLLLHLAALPLLLLIGFWVLHGFVEHLKAPIQAPIQAPVQSRNQLDVAKAPLPEAPVRPTDEHDAMLLIGDWIIGAACSSSDELVTALRSGDRPKLDPFLRNKDGFPVTTGRVVDLRLNGLEDALLEIVGTGSTLLEREEHVRMLALVEQLVPLALEQAVEVLQRSSAPRKLRLLWLVPKAVDASRFPELMAWFRERHLSEFPTDDYVLSIESVSSEVDTLQTVDKLMAGCRQDSMVDDVFLVFGGSSAVSEAVINAWDAEERLFTANCQTGMVPGEAGACLLLCSPGASFAGDIGPAVVLTRAEWLQRDKPIHAPGRVSGKTVETLLGNLLTRHQVVPSEVGMIVTDGDHDAARTGELHAALGERFELVDPITDCLAIGAACGTVLPIASLAALACCRSATAAGGGPALYVSQHDPVERAAVLTTPFHHRLDDDETSSAITDH